MEMNTRILHGGKEWPRYEADLNTVCNDCIDNVGVSTLKNPYVPSHPVTGITL
jgi:hypothetical protein